MSTKKSKFRCVFECQTKLNKSAKAEEREKIGIKSGPYPETWRLPSVPLTADENPSSIAYLAFSICLQLSRWLLDASTATERRSLSLKRKKAVYFAPSVKFYCHSCRKLCNIQAVIFLECNLDELHFRRRRTMQFVALATMSTGGQ